jgi:superoxide dismutase
MTTYSLPALRYALDALEPMLSADTLELHYHKHHAAYVKGANDAIEELADARRLSAFADIGRLEKNLAFNLSGHVLHSLLWRCLTPEGGGRPSGALSEAIDSHFGAFDAFKDELSAVATSLQGSGWGALSWDLRPSTQRRGRDRADRRARHVGARVLLAASEPQGRVGRQLLEARRLEGRRDSIRTRAARGCRPALT